MLWLRSWLGFVCVQAQPKAEGGLAKQPSGAAPENEEDQAAKEEADARSVYVGNVDYEATPEELQLHFQVCLMLLLMKWATQIWGLGGQHTIAVSFNDPDVVQSTNCCLLSTLSTKARYMRIKSNTSLQYLHNL